mmetsp:Transcript_6311/g.10027  ORF Transcript_6311/g.10027 Transcript_6311/m.10027 type:complete len:151 (+) Transcript_6311:1125-1577(+)
MYVVHVEDVVHEANGSHQAHMSVFTRTWPCRAVLHAHHPPRARVTCTDQATEPMGRGSKAVATWHSHALAPRVGVGRVVQVAAVQGAAVQLVQVLVAVQAVQQANVAAERVDAAHALRRVEAQVLVTAVWQARHIKSKRSSESLTQLSAP